ncbi:MAG: mevalonate kinase, partial [Coxiella sp. (in: Bacteria)]
KKKIVTARTPGKLILSGEHAVVHGAPALAIAINRHIETTVQKGNGPDILFDIKSLGLQKHIPLVIVNKIKDKIAKQYKKFRDGKLSITDVLKQPIDLAYYTFANVFEGITGGMEAGSEISIHSDIPMSCGMGSSAASTTCLLTALNEAYTLTLPQSKLIKLAIESESLQHGISSGLDVHVVTQGGCLYFQKGASETRSLPQFPLHIAMTGKPISSTGDCVEAVAPLFENSDLLQRFTETTQQLDQAIQENDLTTIKKMIRRNHQLLVEIGVVPPIVQTFINQLESADVAAKICGAGAIAGDQAGAVLMVGDMQKAKLIAENFKFPIELIEGADRGSHIL